MQMVHRSAGNLRIAGTDHQRRAYKTFLLYEFSIECVKIIPHSGRHVFYCLNMFSSDKEEVERDTSIRPRIFRH